MPDRRAHVLTLAVCYEDGSVIEAGCMELDFRSFWPVATVSGLAAGAGVEDEGVIDALFGGSRLGAEGRG